MKNDPSVFSSSPVTPAFICLIYSDKKQAGSDDVSSGLKKKKKDIFNTKNVRNSKNTVEISEVNLECSWYFHHLFFSGGSFFKQRSPFVSWT